jgi:hypothetical protein
MLYIRIELWPRGQRDQARVLGEATIANVGGGEKMAHYDAKIAKFGGFTLRQGDFYDPEGARVCRPLAASVWKTGKVMNFARKRGPWVLLLKALQACLS